MISRFATSRNGIVVYLDDDATHVTFHIRETPDLLSLVKEAIERSDITDSDQHVFEYDLGRVAGTTTLVQTDATDEIVYAKRKERDLYSRFVKDRQPIPCRHVVVVVRTDSERTYLWTAMCARLQPADFYDPASAFSASHALVYDESLIQMDTLRLDSPFGLH